MTLVTGRWPNGAAAVRRPKPEVKKGEARTWRRVACLLRAARRDKVEREGLIEENKKLEGQAAAASSTIDASLKLREELRREKAQGDVRCRAHGTRRKRCTYERWPCRKSGMLL